MTSITMPPVTTIKKSNKTTFSIVAWVMQENNKNVLKTVKFTTHWLMTCFKDLQLFLPFKLNKVVQLMDLGEKAIAFGDFGRSLLKITHEFTIGFYNNFSIPNIIRRTFDLSWNFFKFCKALKRGDIYKIATRTFVGISTCGGLSFAITSADGFYKNLSNINAIQSSTSSKKEVKIMKELLEMAKNIAAFAIGLIVAAAAVYGYIAPGIVMLGLGTIMLVSNFVTTYYKISYDLK